VWVSRVRRSSAHPILDLLLYLEVSQRALITSNRKSMPAYMQAHWAGGGHLWGVFWVRSGMTISPLARDLFLIWDASEAEDWIDRVGWIPL